MISHFEIYFPLGLPRGKRESCIDSFALVVRKRTSMLGIRFISDSQLPGAGVVDQDVVKITLKRNSARRPSKNLRWARLTTQS